MAITELNHFFVRARDLEETKNFYCDMLGFEVMPRPNFPFPGYWLGREGKIQIHMGQSGIPNAGKYYIGTPDNAPDDNTGMVDHVAFLAENPKEFVDRFQQNKIEFMPRSFPEFDLYQIFLKDPNGVAIELNFFGLKNMKDWGGEMYSEMPRVN